MEVLLPANAARAAHAMSRAGNAVQAHDFEKVATAYSSWREFVTERFLKQVAYYSSMPEPLHHMEDVPIDGLILQPGCNA